MKGLFLLLGILLWLAGLAAIAVSLADTCTWSCGIATLQSEANSLLFGIALILGGAASGVFGVAFTDTDKAVGQRADLILELRELREQLRSVQIQASGSPQDKPLPPPHAN